MSTTAIPETTPIINADIFIAVPASSSRPSTIIATPTLPRRSTLQLVDRVVLSALRVGRCISHLSVCLALALSGLLGLLVSLPLLLFYLFLRSLIGTLLCRRLFGDLSPGIFLFLSLVVEAPDDDAGRSTQLVELGDVLAFGGIFAVVIEPVLLSHRQYNTQSEYERC